MAIDDPQGVIYPSLLSLFTMNARPGDLALRSLRLRREQLLLAIEDRSLQPTMDVISELAEINRALGEAEG